MDPGNGHLYGHDGVVATSLHDWEQDYGAVGQWLTIPTAEELVELQAKAKAYDEGEYLLSCIGADLNICLVNISESSYMQQKGYTCSKVRVCKEVES